MLIKDLDYKVDLHIVLLQTECIRMELFLKDKIKRKYHITTDSIIEVNTRKDIELIKEVEGVRPPLTEKWFVEIDLERLDCNELMVSMKKVNTCIFFCKCNNYLIYKKYKPICDAEFYMMYLKRPDIIYLYDAFMLEKNKLDRNLFSYFINSYNTDVEAVFDLITHDKKITSRKEMAELCGIGGLSIESFIFNLLGNISGSEKGLKRVLKNKISACLDLANYLGYKKFYYYMNSAILRFSEIKLLLMNGVVYKTIRDIPEGYDQKLDMYNKYVWRLKDIPLSHILELKQALGNKVFRNELDCINFVYKYYTMKQDRVSEKLSQEVD